MAEETSDLAERVAGALTDAPAEQAGDEPSPVSKLAVELEKAGVTADAVPQVIDRIRMLQTPEGQAAIVEQYLSTERGKAFRERVSQEELAKLAVSKPEALMDIAVKMGAKVPGAEPEEDVPVDEKVNRNIQQLEARLNAKLAQLEQGAQQTNRTVSEALSKADRQEAFLGWAQTKPNLKTEQYRAVNERAGELVRLYPEKYAGPGGYKAAAQSAYEGLQSTSTVFAPPGRPKSVRQTGGGVAGKQQVVNPFEDEDAVSKLNERDFKALLSKQITSAAEDYAAVMAGREE